MVRHTFHWSAALAIICALGLAEITCGRAAEGDFRPGQVYYGRSNYVAYIAGDLPLIFSVPHGGTLTPTEIPDRNCAGYSADCATISDANTEELALAVEEVFRRDYGHSPHVIICRLKRTKLDCNREVVEGAAGNVHAQRAWEEFHRYINIARDAVVASAGRGFYIDLHGQSHPIRRIELGYLLSGEQLTNTDAILNQPEYASQSSIRRLAAHVAIPFSQLVRGSNSFGALLSARGYLSVPSPAMPNACTGGPPTSGTAVQDLYFSGGYNTRIYSSINAGSRLDGLQMEVHFVGVRDTSENRAKFSAALASALHEFFAAHYGVDLRTGVMPRQ